MYEHIISIKFLILANPNSNQMKFLISHLHDVKFDILRINTGWTRNGHCITSSTFQIAEAYFGIPR